MDGVLRQCCSQCEAVEVFVLMENWNIRTLVIIIEVYSLRQIWMGFLINLANQIKLEIQWRVFSIYRSPVKIFNLANWFRFLFTVCMFVGKRYSSTVIPYSSNGATRFLTILLVGKAVCIWSFLVIVITFRKTWRWQITWDGERIPSLMSITTLQNEYELLSISHTYFLNKVGEDLRKEKQWSK